MEKPQCNYDESAVWEHPEIIAEEKPRSCLEGDI